MRPFAAIALVLFFAAQSALAQLPASRLDSIFPAGARAGTTVDVKLTGNDLDDAAELHFSHPGITATPKMAEATAFDKEPQPIPNQFVVTVAGNVPVGTFDVRVRGKYGLSNPRVFDLSNLADLTEVEPNNELDQATELALPQIVNGQINANTDVDMFRFTAPAGQRILFDCHARRIDSLLNPTLSVYDAKGRELVNNRNGHAREALIDFQVPATGDYYVRISDAFYRGGANYVYRLAIGPLPHIDYIFPPAGLAGSNLQYMVYGRNLPGGQPSEFQVDGKRLDKLAVNVALPGDPAIVQPMNGRVDPEQAFLDAVEYRVQGAPAPSNPVCVGIATAPVVLEAAANDSPQQAQKLSPPCEVAGQFYPSRDNDWYTFDAKKDETYTIEVISHRLGLPTDPQLVIQEVTKNDDGEEQVKALVAVDDIGTRDRAQFDTRTGDSSYKLVAAADATYRVTVRDGYSLLRSDPRLVYRLAIRKEQPDFRLVAVPRDPWGALVLRKGDRTTVDVLAERRDGLTEPITLSVTGMPAGVTSTPVTLGPSKSVATLVLTAADNVAPAISNLKIVGTSKIADRDVTRVARCGTANTPRAMLQPNQQPANSLPARVSREIALSVVDGVSPFAVQLKNDKVWETTRAGILKIPYTAKRQSEYKGQVQCQIENLPANINRTAFNIAANNAAGEFQLTLRTNTPAGTYSLHAGAFVAAYSYSRNPEAAEAAKKRKEAIDKIAVDAGNASKAATTAKQQADKLATDTANAVKAAELKQTQTKTAETAAVNAQRQAVEASTKAKAAAAAKPDDAALKNAVTAADKVTTDAIAKAKVATDAAIAANKALEETQAKAKDATEKKAIADKAAEEATAFVKAAADEKKVTDKRATDTANAAKAKNINYWTASTPVTIKIHEYPVTFAALPEATKIKQGEKIELPISIARLVEYKDQVSFTTVVRGVSGLTLPNVNIPANQSQIKLAITAAANATPGKHEITLRATMRVNNQTLTFDQPFNLEIEKVEPKKP
ncbi:MAG: pre-peptidase C-terminal domain-containing protein [Planctomycetes bacterium]|nr:pre-peptidase C-terminal domain-containing protein [Planctomycetota bacterium]